jgi:DNA-binding protein YbaB
MFDKLKQINELKKLQGEMKKERYDIEKNGVKLVMNGSLELEEVQLAEGLSTTEQASAILQAHNELIKKVQMAMAQRFQGMM